MRSDVGYEPAIEQAGAGDPIVLVHGTPLDLRCWDTLVPTLSKELHVIRYDVRGHGTQAHCAVPGSYGALADDLGAVLDRLGLERAHLVGHSFGGQIVQAFAVRAPERVESLTVLCARARPFEPFATAAASIRESGVEALVEPTLARWFVPSALAAGGPAAEAGVVAYVRERLRQIDPGRYAAALELIASFDLLGQLGEIEAPARFIAAERDAVSGPQELKLSADAAPLGELVSFSQAGHVLPLEHPLSIARMLTDVLSSPSR
jgi:pimeloyl-ACP methyl ester carboxylesterase